MLEDGQEQNSFALQPHPLVLFSKCGSFEVVSVHAFGDSQFSRLFEQLNEFPTELVDLIQIHSDVRWDSFEVPQLGSLILQCRLLLLLHCDIFLNFGVILLMQDPE